MFLVVFRFSSPISFIRLGGFSPSFHSFFQRFPHSAELTSKKGGNNINVTLGAGAESSKSESHVIIIIQNFTLISLSSTATLHPVGLPFGTMVPSHLMHLTTYTRLLTVYIIRRYFRLWKLSIFPLLIKEWDDFFLSITRWRGVWAVGWMQLSSLLSCTDINLVIGIGQGLLARLQKSTFGISPVLVKID